mmetsp:Transcript_13433/g.24327  ORF Transcript_13433/g.24327 Transcript_13433/m.24327 type:complete len:84 (+) Transcript_13433:85-336(+)
MVKMYIYLNILPQGTNKTVVAFHSSHTSITHFTTIAFSAASASTTQTKLSPPFSVLTIPHGNGAGSVITTSTALAPSTFSAIP